MVVPAIPEVEEPQTLWAGVIRVLVTFNGDTTTSTLTLPDQERCPDQQITFGPAGATLYSPVELKAVLILSNGDHPFLQVDPDQPAILDGVPLDGCRIIVREQVQLLLGETHVLLYVIAETKGDKNV